jgi:hypothetical protein
MNGMAFSMTSRIRPPTTSASERSSESIGIVSKVEPQRRHKAELPGAKSTTSCRRPHSWHSRMLVKPPVAPSSLPLSAIVEELTTKPLV